MSEEKRQIKHDLLNCLAVIRGNIDIMEMEKADPDMIEDMKSAVDELEAKIPLLLNN